MTVKRYRPTQPSFWIYPPMEEVDNGAYFKCTDPCRDSTVRGELVNIKNVLQETGFEICLFPPDNDPCECCKKPNKQLYFQGPTDAGRYYCAECVLKEYISNQDHVQVVEKGELANISRNSKVTIWDCSPVRHNAIQVWAAWLIEDGSTHPKYRTMKQGRIQWTTNALEALHFVRKEDAERFAEEDEDA